MKDKLSNREAIYGKKNSEDLGCLLMFLGGALPYRLLTVIVVSIGIMVFQKDCSNGDTRSKSKDIYQYDLNGERMGVWTWHFPNGEKELEGLYRRGKRHGVWTEWWKNGKVKSICSYRMGTPEGRCADWYENGQKASEREFLEGHLATAKVWLPNGQICSDSNVEDGDGRFFIHGRKGHRTHALTFRNGKKVASHYINTIPKIR